MSTTAMTFFLTKIRGAAVHFVPRGDLAPLLEDDLFPY